MSALEENSKNILGCPVDLLSFQEALEQVKQLFEKKTAAHIITLNPEMIMYAQENDEFKEIINEAELIVPDGVGVTIALKFLGIKQERIPGIDFSYKLLEYCAQNNLKVALVGSKEGVAQRAKEKLCEKIEGLDIVFVYNGYFCDDDKILKKLEDCSVDLLLLGLGSPRQEKLIYNYKKILKSTIMIGVGGSFDVLSENVKRAPKIFQRVGLEWLYRLVIEPSRFGRMFPTLPLFLLKVILNGRKES